MQELTRFPELENVILIEENFIPKYKEIQSLLKSDFAQNKFKAFERILFNRETVDCISFEDISRTDKDRFKHQICPVCRVQDSDKALVFLFDRKYVIKKINENSFDCYTDISNIPYSKEGYNLYDVGTFELKYSEYEIVYCIIKKLAKFEIFKDKEEFDTVYNFCKTLFNGTEKYFLTCLIHPYKLDGYSAYPHDYNKIEHYSDLKNCLLKIKNSLVNTSAPPANEQPTNTKEFDNTTLTQIQNGDNYKELLDDSLVIELVDGEVNWIDVHKEINEFLHLKPLWKRYKFTIDNTPLQERVDRFKDIYYWLHHEVNWNRIKNFVIENESWKDKKILIKDVSSKHDTIREYYKHLKNLSLYIKNNRRELNITDNDLQDLKKRREELNFIANSLDSLIWNEWGRDHEHFGGEYMTYTEKNIVSNDMYFPKFYLSKLWGILDKYCDVKNEGSDCSHHSATYFTTSKGEQVYITARFLNLLQNIFEKRRSTFDDIIQYLEPTVTILSAKKKFVEQQTGFNLGYSETQLEALYKALIDGNFLFSNCNLDHFKNAFDGSVLKDYLPLKWKEPTKGSIFIRYHFSDERHFWVKSNILFEKANYKQLLSQSKKSNNTFDTVTNDIKMIDILIKKVVNIDSK